jgi:hypothetical protein
VYAYGDDQRKSSEVRVKKSKFDFLLNPGTAPSTRCLFLWPATVGLSTLFFPELNLWKSCFNSSTAVSRWA